MTKIPIEPGLRVYIAGALSSKEKDKRNPSKVVTDYIMNVSRMCRIAGIVRKAGHYPYVPALDLLIGVVDGGFIEEDYRGIGMAFLEVCDAVLVISKSYGVEQEIARAKELGIPVFYKLLDIMPEAGVK